MISDTQLKNLCRFTQRIKTIGVNGLSQEDFIKELEKIQNNKTISLFGKSYVLGKKIVVVEIRNNPHVKKGFRPKDLKELLDANDFEYLRLKHLGNPFYKTHLKEDYPWSIKKQEYQDHVLSDEQASSEFKKLFGLIKSLKIYCLICYCRSVYCHRHWLRELLINERRKELGLVPLIEPNEIIIDEKEFECNQDCINCDYFMDTCDNEKALKLRYEINQKIERGERIEQENRS